MKQFQSSMKKEQLHHNIIAGVVALSLLSFVFLNFFSSSAPLCVKATADVAASVERMEKEDDGTTEKAGAPKQLIALGHLFEIVKKVVPGK